MGFLTDVTSQIFVLASFAIWDVAEYQDKTPKLYDWQLIAWTAFSVWLRFILALRSVDYFSSVISMVWESLKESIPYLVVVLLGVLTFANVFIVLE